MTGLERRRYLGRAFVPRTKPAPVPKHREVGCDNSDKRGWLLEDLSGRGAKYGNHELLT